MYAAAVTRITLPIVVILQMPLDGPQLAEQGTDFNKNFFADFKVSEGFDALMSTPGGDDVVCEAWAAKRNDMLPGMWPVQRLTLL